MKKLALILGLLVTQWGFSQTTKEVGAFTSVTVFDKISATLVPAKEYKVELSGDGHKNVSLINKNGSLKIKMDFKNTLQGDDVKATIYYKNLDEIIVDEGASIKSDTTIKDVALNVNVKKGGKLDLKVDVERLNVKGSTGGISTIKGKANVQDIISNSGAMINHKDLETKQTEVTVNAGGEAQVKASDVVDAKTRAGGSILIYGNPKTVTEKMIAGGTIKKVK